jgi:RNA polymerase sigma-70 factor, ECF subfamily
VRVDAEARFRALFTDAFPALRRYAHHRGLSASDADDLLAEVFTVAWRRIDDVPSDALPWLFAVARNVRRNQRRADARRARMLARLPPPDPELPVEPDAPAERARIGRALAALDAADRELLVLIAWDDLTPAQAAGALGWSPGSTRVRLHRARRRFAERLGALETRGDGRTQPVRDRVALPEVPDARS